MAGEGYRALAAAKQKQRKIGRERAIGMEAISSIGEVATFAGGQAKKAKTAWGEYETGYKEIGKGIEGFEGTDFKRGSFWKQAGQTLMPGGDKGFFQMPEGEVTIGKKVYDREQIQKAGSFLGSDAAAVLDKGARKKYLERTAPGRDLPTYTRSLGKEYTGIGHDFSQADGGVGVWSGFGQGSGGRFSPVIPKPVIPKTASGKEYTGTSGGVGVGFVPGDMFSGFGKDWEATELYSEEELAEAKEEGLTFDPKTGGFASYKPKHAPIYAQPDLKAVGSTITDADRAETAAIQTQQYEALGKSARINEMLKARNDADGGGTGVKTGVSQIPESPYSYEKMKGGAAGAYGGEVKEDIWSREERDLMRREGLIYNPKTGLVESQQDPYTDKQRQPYLENSEKSFWDTSFLSRGKHDGGGGETGWLTGLFNQDEDEYNGR